MRMLAKFHSKLKSAPTTEAPAPAVEMADDDEGTDASWLAHELVDTAKRTAKVGNILCITRRHNALRRASTRNWTPTRLS